LRGYIQEQGHGPGHGPHEGRQHHGHGHQHGFWHGPRQHGFGGFGPGAHHWRNRWHGHGRGPGRGPGGGPGGDWREFFGEGGAPWEWGQREDWFGRGFGGRERLERGTLRYIIMDVLKDSPKHGYEIIKQLEERTHGSYSPSPGTLYPTLQLLEDQGIVHSDQESDRRVYQLTEAGHAELDKNAGLVEGFWSRFQDRRPSKPDMYELKFAADAMKDLLRTVAIGLRTGAFSGDPDTVRKVRQALERCQNEIREIITQSTTQGPASAGSEENGGQEGQGTTRL
jgi:DNA-binding PadR family transcriptional regulator